MAITLNAHATDFTLNAQPMPKGSAVVSTISVYLTDTLGNKLTDPQGNYLIASMYQTVYPLLLNGFASDLTLNAEQS